MALYTETVMDHFMHPRNVGTLEHPDAEGEVGNAKCGDIMKMQLQIENGIITDVRFETFGCGSAIASSSIATEMIKGKTVEEALSITNKQVVDALGGLPAHKLHCPLSRTITTKTALNTTGSCFPTATAARRVEWSERVRSSRTAALRVKSFGRFAY